MMSVKEVQWRQPAGALLKFLLLLILFAGMRSVFTTDIEWGGDAIRGWRASAELGRDASVVTRNHHTARWSMNLPAAVVQKIFPNRPFAYYLPALFFFSLMVLLLLRLARTVLSPYFLLLLGIILLADPMLFRSSSQFKPFCFGGVYALLAVMCLLRYLDRSQYRYLAGTAFCCFLAYGAKIPYAFFCPGIMLFLVLRKDLRGALTLALFFFLFVGIETVIFNYLSSGQLALGRLELVGRGESAATRYFHQSEELRSGDNDLLLHLIKWVDIPLPDFLVAMAGLGTAFILLCRRNRMKNEPVIFLLALMVLSYCLCEMFFFFQFSPFRTYHFPRAKYVAFLMPFLALLAVWGMQEGSRRWGLKFAAVFLIAAVCLSAGYFQVSMERSFHYHYTGTKYPGMDFGIYRAGAIARNVSRLLEQGRGIFVVPLSEGYGISRKYVCTVSGFSDDVCGDLVFKRAFTAKEEEKYRRYFFYDPGREFPAKCTELRWGAMDAAGRDVPCPRRIINDRGAKNK